MYSFVLDHALPLTMKPSANSAFERHLMFFLSSFLPTYPPVLLALHRHGMEGRDTAPMPVGGVAPSSSFAEKSAVRVMVSCLLDMSYIRNYLLQYPLCHYFETVHMVLSISLRQN